MNFSARVGTGWKVYPTAGLAAMSLDLNEEVGCSDCVSADEDCLYCAASSKFDNTVFSAPSYCSCSKAANGELFTCPEAIREQYEVFDSKPDCTFRSPQGEIILWGSIILPLLLVGLAVCTYVARRRGDHVSNTLTEWMEHRRVEVRMSGPGVQIVNQSGEVVWRSGADDDDDVATASTVDSEASEDSYDYEVPVAKSVPAAVARARADDEGSPESDEGDSQPGEAEGARLPEL